MPRWHATIVDDFQNGVPPTDDFVIAGQRKRRNLTLTMTLDAMLIEDSRDLIRKGDRTRRIGRSLATDEASNNLGRWSTHTPRSQQVVNRAGNERLLRLIADVADSVLIVDSTVVTHDAFFVENQNLWRASRSDLIGDSVIEILQNWKTNLVNPCIGRDFRNRIVPV